MLKEESASGTWPRQAGVIINVFSLAKVSTANASHDGLPNEGCHTHISTGARSSREMLNSVDGESGKAWFSSPLLSVYRNRDLNFSVVTADSLWSTGGEKEASCIWILLFRVNKSSLYLLDISLTADIGHTEEQREAAHQPALCKQYLLQSVAGNGCTRLHGNREIWSSSVSCGSAVPIVADGICHLPLRECKMTDHVKRSCAESCWHAIFILGDRTSSADGRLYIYAHVYVIYVYTSERERYKLPCINKMLAQLQSTIEMLYFYFIKFIFCCLFVSFESSFNTFRFKHQC